MVVDSSSIFITVASLLTKYVQQYVNVSFCKIRERGGAVQVLKHVGAGTKEIRGMRR